jgi:DNA-binding response OmpR family regulator
LSLAGRADVTVNERTVDVHISHLRKKLASGDGPGKVIQTVRGVGYVLNSEGS